MPELKCVCSAILYVLAQLVVIVLKPVVGLLDKAATKCGEIAGQKLAALKPAEVKAPET